MQMMEHSFFADKKIFVIDQSPKNINDHTWCFWEQQPGIFEPVVHHQWKQISFYSNDFSAGFDIEPYLYKMIRSIDLYNYVLEKATKHPNIQFHYGNVQSITNENDKAIATIDGKVFSADYIFNSILLNAPVLNSPSGVGGLLQHFKGWLIETGENIFDDSIATFMDFRVAQNRGTTFVYVLPVAKNRALVEYTIFSEKILQQDEYDNALKQYITECLKIDNYKIIEEESGTIPMTDYRFPAGKGKIINTGTASGQTKASSGFTFRFIQKHSTAIINALVHAKDPHIKKSFFQKRFNIYDSTLLDILQNKKMGGDEIFVSLFKKNKPQQVLKFLDNETVLSEELKIMNSVPAKVFLPAALKAFFKNGQIIALSEIKINL